LAKRKLTRQQARRVAKRHEQHRQCGNASASDAEQKTGLVLARFGKQADVEDSDGSITRCHFRTHLGDVVTGDRVIWQQNNDSGVIVSVEPSRNRLLRPDSFGKLRAIAANIDQVLITVAPEPEPFSGLIDRYLVVAESLRITPILVLNKSDLLSNERHSELSILLNSYRQLGYDLIEVSAKTGTGIEELRKRLCEKTSIFTGQSGVGKSSVLQQLLPDESLKIGALSEQVAKGRHTTTHAQLYHFSEGGNCIDSPGIREFGLWHLSKDDVIYGFVELRNLAGQCKFRDCRHQQEPGCAISSAVQENRISAARFESFSRIIQSLDDVEIRTDAFRQ